MSRVGRKLLHVPEGVSIKVDKEAQSVLAKGPKGELSSPLPKGLELEQNGSVLELKCNDPALRSMYGTARALLSNNMKGVHEGWEKQLELVGVGYRAQLKAKELVLSLGYSHDMRFPLPEGLSAQLTEQTKIRLSCIDKQRLGQAAAEIRSLRPPEPYKAKGIRYSNEQLRRKAGKAAKAGKK